MTQMVRVAVAQMCSGIDPQANCEALCDAVAQAAQGGAKILFTPEMSGLLDSNRVRAREHITTEENNTTLAALQSAAAEHKIWLHIGSLALLSEAGDGRLVNRGFVINAEGVIVARYDKIHLFDVDLPSGESWRESSAYSPGALPVVVQTPLGTLGLSICYDLRFPTLYTALSSADAHVLSIPAAFTVPTGQAHWHTLLRARAIENACFVIAAAQSGTHEDGRATYGHSLVISPWGEVLLDMGEGAQVGFAELDLAQVDVVRQRIPVIAHRRPIGVVYQA